MVNVARGRFGILALLLAVAGGVALPPALRRLEQVRHRHDALSAVLQRPVPKVRPVVAPEAVFRGDRHAAEGALTATIRDLATRERALVERNEPRPAPAPGLVARHAVISGDARAILRLVEAIEARTPVIRLPSYRLATTASGRSLRLEADLVMAFAP